MRCAHLQNHPQNINQYLCAQISQEDSTCKYTPTLVKCYYFIPFYANGAYDSTSSPDSKTSS